MHGNKIRLLIEFIEGDQSDAQLLGHVRGNERVMGNHAHFQPLGAVGNYRAHSSQTDDPQCFIAKFIAHKFAFFPFSGLHGSSGLRNAAGQ